MSKRRGFEKLEFKEALELEEQRTKDLFGQLKYLNLYNAADADTQDCLDVAVETNYLMSSYICSEVRLDNIHCVDVDKHGHFRMSEEPLKFHLGIRTSLLGSRSCVKLHVSSYKKIEKMLENLPSPSGKKYLQKMFGEVEETVPPTYEECASFDDNFKLS